MHMHMHMHMHHCGPVLRVPLLRARACVLAGPTFAYSSGDSARGRLRLGVCFTGIVTVTITRPIITPLGLALTLTLTRRGPPCSRDYSNIGLRAGGDGGIIGQGSHIHCHGGRHCRSYRLIVVAATATATRIRPPTGVNHAASTWPACDDGAGRKRQVRAGAVLQSLVAGEWQRRYFLRRFRRRQVAGLPARPAMGTVCSAASNQDCGRALLQHGQPLS
jgi:hypothetical protein